MKHLFIILTSILILCSCKNQANQSEFVNNQQILLKINNDYTGFWQIENIGKFTDNNVLFFYKTASSNEVRGYFSNIKVGKENISAPFNNNCEFNIIVTKKDISNDIFPNATDYENTYRESLLEFNIKLKDSLTVLLNEHYKQPKSYSSNIEENPCNAYQYFWFTDNKLITFYYDNIIIYKKITEQEFKVNLEQQVKKECYEINDDNGYGFTNICEYEKMTNYKYLYKQITKEYKDELLEELPVKDTLYSTLSVPEIEYLIKKDTIKIIRTSEGGEIIFRIYKKKNNGVISIEKSI